MVLKKKKEKHNKNLETETLTGNPANRITSAARVAKHTKGEGGGGGEKRFRKQYGELDDIVKQKDLGKEGTQGEKSKIKFRRTLTNPPSTV